MIYVRDMKFKVDKQQAGFTLLEAMVVVTIIGVLIAFAIPGFNKPINKQRMNNTSEAIALDLRWARAEAIKRNADVEVEFTDGAPGNWSYEIAVLTTVPAVTIKTVDSANIQEFDNVALSQDFASDTVTFDSVRGTANSGAVTLSLSDVPLDIYYGMKIEVNLLGSVNACNDNDGTNTLMPGYADC